MRRVTKLDRRREIIYEKSNMAVVGKDEMTSDFNVLHSPISHHDHVTSEGTYSWPINPSNKCLITLKIYFYKPSDRITRSHVLLFKKFNCITISY